MTYRQLLDAMRRAEELEAELARLQSSYPSKGSPEEQDKADALYRHIEDQLHEEIT